MMCMCPFADPLIHYVVPVGGQIELATAPFWWRTGFIAWIEIDSFTLRWNHPCSCLLHRLFSVPFFKESRREIGYENDNLPRWLMEGGKKGREALLPLSFPSFPAAHFSCRPLFHPNILDSVKLTEWLGLFWWSVAGNLWKKAMCTGC